MEDVTEAVHDRDVHDRDVDGGVDGGVGEEVVLPERVAGLDVGKRTVMACVRVPGRSGSSRRVQQVREYTTTRAGLHELADWLVVHRVQVAGMEATSDYWKPVYYLLEERGLVPQLLNARHVKNVPGRAKTDKLDAVWLAKVIETGMCRPSLVHPKPIRDLRDHTRRRRTLIRERTREVQRLEKVLEDAQIKLSAQISELLGVSGRAMIEALIAGETNPTRLADLARGPMRAKIGVLRRALDGRFDDHHRFTARSILDLIDYLTAQIHRHDQQIAQLSTPYRHQLDQLDGITGIGVVAAQELIGEIGVDMGRFPTAAHLVSWAKYSPQLRQSAGKNKNTPTGKGNPWLAGILGDIAATAARTPTRLGARYRRLAKRRGKKRALVALGHTILNIIWNLLSDPEATYHDLGPDYYNHKPGPDRQTTLIRDLEHLTGAKVTLTPPAA